MSFTNESGTLVEWDASIATETGPIRKTYPFDGSIEYTFDQDYVQLRSAYQEPTLSSEHPTASGYYLVRQTAPEQAGGAMCRFTRTYAPIFAPRREMEPYAYTIPGISNDGEYTANIYISGATVADGKHYITTLTPHGFSAPVGLSPGTGIIVNYWTKDTINSWSIIYGRAVYREVLEVTSPTQFAVWLITDIGPITWSECHENMSTRKPRSRVVSSFLHFDYWLPGVSTGIDSMDDITILQPPKIVDSTGNETDSYSTTTTPTVADYRAQISRGEWIVAEPSNIRRFAGHLYERSTRYVVAI